MMCVRKEGIDDDMFECKRCGKPFRLQPQGVGLPVRRQCSTGIGDIVAAGLSLLGFKKCGGCSKRQAALNELGKKVGL